MAKIADLTIDPKIQLEARGIDYEIVLEYIEAIQGGSEFPPVKAVSDNGTLWLYDGFHRVEAHRSLGLLDIEIETRPGTRTDALILAVLANILNGKPMSRAQKKEGGERLLEMTDWSDSKIARKLAVYHTTVMRWRKTLSCANAQDKIRSVTRGGAIYTMDVSNIGCSQRLDPDKMDKAIVRERIEKGNGIVECVRCQNLYDGSKIDFCPYCAYTREQRVAYLRGEQTRPPHVSHNAGDNEWYTPLEFIEAARDVMGNIDLDPASTSIANEIIQAGRFYTKEDDGLSRDWAGKVWMNPPYASGLIDKFIAKLVEHVKDGQVTDAIVLVNNATETSWFSELTSVASAVCFPLGRVKFWAPDKVSAPLQGQAIIYIGGETNKFLSRFQQFGWAARIFKGDESGNGPSIS